MSATEARTEAAVPESVESAEAKLVYLYLAEADAASAGTIASALSLSKLSVLGVLGTLQRRGIVESRDGRYRVT